MCIVIGSLCFASLTHASVVACRQAFEVRDSIFRKFQERIEEVNPELTVFDSKEVEEIEKLFSLYMSLKEEGWKVNPRGEIPWKDRPILSEELMARIKNTYSDRFNLKEADETQLYVFYGNWLQGLYIQVSQALIQKYVSQWGMEVKQQATLKFMQRVFDDALFPGLGERELSPDRAQEIFFEVQSQWPWRDMVRAIDSFLSQSTLAFDPWYQKHENSFPLSAKVYNLLKKHLGSETFKRRYCCANGSGCLFCPKNRSFRIR